MDPFDEQPPLGSPAQPATPSPPAPDLLADQAAYQVVLTHLRQPPPVIVPPNFAQQLMARLPARQPTRFEHWLWDCSRLAAWLSLLVGVGLTNEYSTLATKQFLTELAPAGPWLVFGLVYFVGLQWLDRRSYTDR